MLVAIDGTGELSPTLYYQNNHNSLIAQLVRETRQNPKKYVAGPTLDGDSCFSAAWAIALDIKRTVGADRGPVFLAGHSRGGAICIAVAGLLRQDNILVECMMLFDAVNRSLSLNAATIPGNVKYAYHAMRNDVVGSRPWFGHCGTSIESPGVLVTYRFNATHAGVGGTPWSGAGSKSWFRDRPTAAWMNRERDQKGTNEVKNWAWMMMRKRGMI